MHHIATHQYKFATSGYMLESEAKHSLQSIVICDLHCYMYTLAHKVIDSQHPLLV